MKKMLCAVLACMLILFTACSAKSTSDARWPAQAGGYSFEHAPKQVVSLSPSATEIIFILGYGGRLAGVSDFCKPPKAAGKLQRCGSALEPDCDKITGLKPDIVFVPAELPKAAREALEKAKIKTVLLKSADTTDDMLENCRIVSTAFEGADKAELVVRQLKLFIDTTVQYIGESIESDIEPGETTALYLRKIPYTVATGDTLEGKLLQEIGFVNPAKQYTLWSYPSDEAQNLDPDYIFCDKSVQTKALQKSSVYKEKAALSNERVYTLDAAIFERRSPRLFLELERVMKEAFPDAFEEPKPSFVLEMEPPPEPEKSWWKKIFDK